MFGKPPLRPQQSRILCGQTVDFSAIFQEGLRGKDARKHLDTYGGDDSPSKEKGASEVPVTAAVGRVSYWAHSRVVSVKSVLQGK